ncbi:MAG: citrate synthase [Eubacterium sp.]|nr:citrate synthase [Eubacterium sp.]
MDNRAMMALGGGLNRAFDRLVDIQGKHGPIDRELYNQYDVKQGLRDTKTGRGVLTGLTEIAEVIGSMDHDGKRVPCEGLLQYRGYDVALLLKNAHSERYNLEKATYLLLFGELPDEEDFAGFLNILASLRELSGSFVRDVIMKAPSENIMNALQKSVLTLYSYDEAPDDISLPNVLRQSLQLIAKVPMIAVYSYHAYMHYVKNADLIIRQPRKDHSTAENILRMVRPDGQFTELEALVLDVALVLHADHGGGNNSTFTDHVVTSSGTDTYSAISASIASLKGPRHGGANLRVQMMFDDLMENCDWHTDAGVEDYLKKILAREAFDRSGLIYGMGHAVYTLSDPREVILKDMAEKLAAETGMEEEFALYDRVERLSKDMIMNSHPGRKPVSANVDMYSGLVYKMLGIPKELYTPIFAIARISGWSAHRIEELANRGKIIRPAYMYVGERREMPEEYKRGDA